MFSKKIFGETIRELRLSHGLKQSELGEKIGLGRSSISRIESGDKAVSIEVLYALSECLNVSTDYLLGRQMNAEETSVAPMESRLLAAFRKLPDDKQATVVTMIEAL